MKGTSPSRAISAAETGIEVPRWEVRTLINLLALGRAQSARRACVGVMGGLYEAKCRIDDAVLALLLLGLHEGDRAWKSFDWDAM